MMKRILILLTLVAASCGQDTVTVITRYHGTSSAVITWNSSTGATSYNVYRGTFSGGPYSKRATTVATTYTDSVIKNNSKACYVVTAVNSSGESGNSNESCVQIP